MTRDSTLARLAALADDLGPDPSAPQAPEGLVRAGRVAVRRRRLTIGAAMAAVLVAVAGTSYAVLGEVGRSEPDYATTSSPSPTQAPGGDETATDTSDWVAYDNDGQLLLAPGAVVDERRDNPLDLAPPLTSVGLAVTLDGRQAWYLLRTTPNGSMVRTGEPGGRFDDFDPWLDWAVKVEQRSAEVTPVELGEGGRLVAVEKGAIIVAERRDIRLGTDFASVRATTAAAKVTWDGGTWFVLARQEPGETADYIPVLLPTELVAGIDDTSTVQEFLDAVRPLYGSDTPSAGLR